MILGLIAVSFVLWRELAKLRARVDQLEGETWSRAFEPAPSAPLPDRPATATMRVPAVVIDQAPPPVWAVEPVAPPAPEPPIEPVAVDPIAIDRVTVEHSDPEPRPRIGFEELFGRRLPIWAGGVTLAVAGFLIVKYSIDSGLLSPLVRMILGLLFGSALIVAAEAALRGEWFVRDPRVRQAFAGAGIATLYATILMAANVYHLIGPLSAFVGIGLVTAAALGLSLRFGAPSAILGLVGGLAAPALIGSGEPNVPLLASYLALTVGGLCAVSRQQRWAWLGAGALIGGFGWGILLLLGGAMDAGSTMSLGILIILLGIAFPLILLADRGAMLRLAAGLVGCAQMAALVALGGFSPLHWGLFGLISAALIWLSRREEAFRPLPPTGLAVALMLTLVWFDATPLALGLVLAGITLLYGGAALLRLWRAEGSLVEAIAIAAIALAILVVPMLRFAAPDASSNAQFATLALIGAAIAGGSASLGWNDSRRKADWRFALLTSVGAALIVAAAVLALPVWAIAPAAALVTAAMLTFACRADDPRIEVAAWGFAGATIALLLSDTDYSQVDRAVGGTRNADPLQALRWAVPAAMAAWFARSAIWPKRITVAAPFAVLLFYIAIAQVLPPVLLPLVPALMLVAIALAIRPTPRPAMIAAWTLVLLWALGPTIDWLIEGAASLGGDPFLSNTLASPTDLATKLALPVAAILLALRHADLPNRARQAAAATAILFATIVAHSLFKQLLKIDSLPRFEALGYAERTLWEAQLAALALLAWQWRARAGTIVLAAAALAHFAWYSLVLHNPLWDAQAAGGWIVPAYATAFCLLWASQRAGLLPSLDRARDWARMLLILLAGLSLLRLAFSGPILSAAPIGPTEDILRSLLGATIAIGFLQYGIVAPKRDWRIASLALTLATVAKVFLRDANGLDGLLRVASFAALGFSLIGIGWLYSRYLPDPGKRPAAAT